MNLANGRNICHSTWQNGSILIRSLVNKKTGCIRIQSFCGCAPTEIRTPVLALKGLRPGPLDDGGFSGGDFTIPPQAGQAF
jgi:hypothetical protein